MSAAPSSTPIPSHWIAPEWPAPAQVRGVITTRAGGASRGAFESFNLGANVGDDALAVAQNRRELRRYLPAEPLWMRQVHGVRVIDAESAAAETEADGAVTRTAGRVLAVLTADCLPVLLCDEAGTVAGIAHAGWRGLAAGVIEAVVAAMRVPPERVLAYIGPGIGAAAYEVGPEVREAFLAQGAEAAQAFTAREGGRFFADLALLARQRLRCVGVARVHAGAHCTYAEEKKFFSFRRDGATGRMASLIWLEEG
ncbi:MAG: peptidoglycan editing factor PgeF [Betaproteobacteria bacterium]|nr:peptidoglycan editing factor PgeF [Betaproteobacteria bacterium]